MFVAALVLTVLQGLSDADPHGQPWHASTGAVIAVIVPDSATSSMVDALNRLRGEAASVGFQVRLVQPPAEGTPQDRLGRVARELSPAAVVALSTDGQGAEEKRAIHAVNVWFLDRASGRISVGHLSVEEKAGDRAEQALAVGVVDFIRARMFDSLVQASAEPKVEVEAPRGAPPIPLGRYQVSVGLGTAGSFSGFSTALLPLLEASVGLRPWLRLSLAAGGLSSRIQRRTSAGSVDVDQRLLKLGAAFVAPALGRRWYLHAEAGLALLLLATHGRGSTGYAGHAPGGSSLGAHCLGGVTLALTSRVVLQSSLGALWLLREQQVFIADQQVARTGRPTWLGSAMLGVMF